MVQNFKVSLNEENGFIQAKKELEARGNIKNIALLNDLYRIEIIVDEVLYFEESDDLKIADYSDESGHPIPEQSGQLFC
jgi:hypothetical protein